MSHQDHTFPCLGCNAPVRIVVPPPAAWLPVFAFWVLELGGLCEQCLKSRNSKGERAA